jgi:hypothetical protein
MEITYDANAPSDADESSHRATPRLSTLERAPVALVHFAFAGIGPENEADVWRLRWPENGGSRCYTGVRPRWSVPVDCVA